MQYTVRVINEKRSALIACQSFITEEAAHLFFDQKAIEYPQYSISLWRKICCSQYEPLYVRRIGENYTIYLGR